MFNITIKGMYMKKILMLISCLLFNFNLFSGEEILEKVQDSFNNNWSWPPLHYAIYNHPEEVAEYIYTIHSNSALELTPEITLIRRTDRLNDDPDDDYIAGTEEGFSALELALKKNMSTLALRMIRDGVPIDTKRKDYFGSEVVYGKWTWWTGKYTQKHTFGVHKRVTHWSANSWRGNYHVYTLLYWAIANGLTDVMDELFARDFELEDVDFTHAERHNFWINLTRERRDNAVEVAARWGNEDVLNRALIAYASRLGIHITDVPEADLAIFKKYGLTEKVTGYDQIEDDMPLLALPIKTGDTEGFSTMLAYGINLEEVNDKVIKIFKLALEHPDSFFINALYQYMQNHSIDTFTKEAITETGA